MSIEFGAMLGMLGLCMRGHGGSRAIWTKVVNNANGFEFGFCRTFPVNMGSVLSVAHRVRVHRYVFSLYHE